MEEMHNRAPNGDPRRPRNRAPTAALRLFNARAPRSDSNIRRQILQALAEFPEDLVGPDVLLRGRERVLALKVIRTFMLKCWRRTESDLNFRIEQCDILGQLLEEKTKQLNDLRRNKEIIMRQLRATLRINARLHDQVVSLHEDLNQLQSKRKSSSEELDDLYDVNAGLEADNTHFHYELYKLFLEVETLRKKSRVGEIMQMCCHYVFRIIDHFITQN